MLTRAPAEDELVVFAALRTGCAAAAAGADLVCATAGAEAVDAAAADADDDADVADARMRWRMMLTDVK